MAVYVRIRRGAAVSSIVARPYIADEECYESIEIILHSYSLCLKVSYRCSIANITILYTRPIKSIMVIKSLKTIKFKRSIPCFL